MLTRPASVILGSKCVVEARCLCDCSTSTNQLIMAMASTVNEDCHLHANGSGGSVRIGAHAVVDRRSHVTSAFIGPAAFVGHEATMGSSSSLAASAVLLPCTTLSANASVGVAIVTDGDVPIASRAWQAHGTHDAVATARGLTFLS